ncbi:YidH family protein [Hydrogenimonas sp.]
MRKIDPKNLMALERAAAALIGVAISFIVLGFVVEKFELFLKIVAVELGDRNATMPSVVQNSAFYNWLGISIVAAGIVLAIFTYFYYTRWIELLKKGRIESDKRVFLFLSLFVTAVGIALLLSMLIF